MSADGPDTKSPPTTTTSATTATSNESNWSQYVNGNSIGNGGSGGANDSATMVLRRRHGRSIDLTSEQMDIDINNDDANDNINDNENFDLDHLNQSGDYSGDGLGIGLSKQSTTSMNINETVAPPPSSLLSSSTSSSTTTYSFSGSALASDGVSNIKEKISLPNLIRNNNNPTPSVSSSSSSSSTTASFNQQQNNENDINGNGNGATTATPNINQSNNQNNNEEKQEDSLYECNICLDTAKDAVVSMCGHLFCWPCLHQWLETRPNRMLCPVCKAAISKDKVIPLYGRNSTKQEDPRNKVPPRPAGQRTEPEPQTGFQGFGFGDGFHMSFGIGAFPFGYFASSFNFGEPRPGPANRGTAQYEDEQQLSKLFLYLAFLCLAWLVFA